MIDPQLKSAIDSAAKQIARSPQQIETFAKGAEFMFGLVEELGVENTVLPQLRREIESLSRSIQQAETIRRELERHVAPVELDDRARQIVTLTRALSLTFKEQLAISRSPHGGSSEMLSERVAAQVVRAVSYTVWAYLNPGVAAPAALSANDE